MVLTKDKNFKKREKRKKLNSNIEKIDRKINEIKVTNTLEPPPYNKSALKFMAHIIMGSTGYIAGFIVSWLFYQNLTISFIVAAVFVPAAIILNINNSKKKRLSRLLLQFQSLLESLVVSLQSGSTDLNALAHAYEDMVLMYSADSDIAKEVKFIMVKFQNRQTIGETFANFGDRTGLEDIKLFASVYSSVEGKGDNTRDIVMRTQKILSDKIEIEAEIKTLSSGASMEINIIVCVPIIIVGAMGFMGGELMEGLFTPIGRIVTTICICIFIGAYFLGKKMTSIKI
ncbi:MAG: type II secretion system F family protein [Defluviitaleaceae bacterium]|nr:type II secretion system F family protein [Defluviitaleaceae bacterium]